MLRVALPPPQRADPRLRVELRRRQPAGACLGHDLHLPAGEGAARARATSTGWSAPSSKLLLNFTWWVNRKDRAGSNVFEGGFLGLDNIGVFDRSAPLPDRRIPRAGGRHRLDGALLPEHARDRGGAGAGPAGLCGHGRQVRRALPVDRLVDDARRRRTSACGTRRTGSSTTCSGCRTARAQRLKVRSMVGLLPLCAVTVFEGELLGKYPAMAQRLRRVPRRRVRS